MSAFIHVIYFAILNFKSVGVIFHLIFPVIDWKWELMNVNRGNICHKVSKTIKTTKIEGCPSLPEKTNRHEPLLCKSFYILVLLYLMSPV